MRHFTLAFFVLIGISSYAQNPISNFLSLHNLEPICGIQSSGNSINGDGVILNSLTIEPGVRFNNGLSVQLSLGYMENFNRSKTVGFKYRNMAASANVSLRLLKPINKLSPALGVSVGSLFFSKLEQRAIIKNQFTTNPEMLSNLDKLHLFVRTKYLIDFQMKRTHFQLGPTYSIYLVSLHNDRGTTDAKLLHGVGIEFNVIQSLQFKTK